MGFASRCIALRTLSHPVPHCFDKAPQFLAVRSLAGKGHGTLIVALGQQYFRAQV